MGRNFKKTVGRRSLGADRAYSSVPRRVKGRTGFVAAIVATTMALSTPVSAYDMDCKVILCLAAGFPDGCGDARSYMSKRLKKLKPPLGPCSGGGDDGSTYDVPVRMFTRKIEPVCSAWVSDRDGRYCSTWIPGRQERVIGIAIPQGEELSDFSSEFTWWSRPWNPADDEK